MTAGLPDATANAALDALVGTFVQLHVGDPGAAGTTNQASVTLRQSQTWNSAASASKSISNQPVWTSWAGSNQTITHISEWTAAIGGTFKRSVQLASGVAVTAGGTFTLQSNTVTAGPRAA